MDTFESLGGVSKSRPRKRRLPVREIVTQALEQNQSKERSRILASADFSMSAIVAAQERCHRGLVARGLFAEQRALLRALRAELVKPIKCAATNREALDSLTRNFDRSAAVLAADEQESRARLAQQMMSTLAKATATAHGKQRLSVESSEALARSHVGALEMDERAAISRARTSTVHSKDEPPPDAAVSKRASVPPTGASRRQRKPRAQGSADRSRKKVVPLSDATATVSKRVRATAPASGAKAQPPPATATKTRVQRVRTKRTLAETAVLPPAAKTDSPPQPNYAAQQPVPDSAAAAPAETAVVPPAAKTDSPPLPDYAAQQPVPDSAAGAPAKRASSKRARAHHASAEKHPHGPTKKSRKHCTPMQKRARGASAKKHPRDQKKARTERAPATKASTLRATAKKHLVRATVASIDHLGGRRKSQMKAEVAAGTLRAPAPAETEPSRAALVVAPAETSPANTHLSASDPAMTAPAKRAAPRRARTHRVSAEKQPRGPAKKSRKDRTPTKRVRARRATAKKHPHNRKKARTQRASAMKPRSPRASAKKHLPRPAVAPIDRLVGPRKPQAKADVVTVALCSADVTLAPAAVEVEPPCADISISKSLHPDDAVQPAQSVVTSAVLRSVGADPALIPVVDMHGPDPSRKRLSITQRLHCAHALRDVARRRRLTAASADLEEVLRQSREIAEQQSRRAQRKPQPESTSLAACVAELVPPARPFSDSAPDDVEAAVDTETAPASEAICSADTMASACPTTTAESATPTACPPTRPQRGKRSRSPGAVARTEQVARRRKAAKSIAERLLEAEALRQPARRTRLITSFVDNESVLRQSFVISEHELRIELRRVADAAALDVSAAITMRAARELSQRTELESRLLGLRSAAASELETQAARELLCLIAISRLCQEEAIARAATASKLFRDFQSSCPRRPAAHIAGQEKRIRSPNDDKAERSLRTRAALRRLFEHSVEQSRAVLRCAYLESALASIVAAAQELAPTEQAAFDCIAAEERQSRLIAARAARARTSKKRARVSTVQEEVRVIDCGDAKAIPAVDLREFMHRLPRDTLLRGHWARPDGTPEDWLCVTLGKRGLYPTVRWSHRPPKADEEIDPAMSHAGNWAHLRDDDGAPTFIVESIPASTYIGDIRRLEVITMPM